MLKKAEELVKNISGEEAYPAQTLTSFLSNDPLWMIYDPSDDADEFHSKSPQIVSRVFFMRKGTRHYFFLIEFDLRLKNFWEHCEKEIQRIVQEE